MVSAAPPCRLPPLPAALLPRSEEVAAHPLPIPFLPERLRRSCCAATSFTYNSNATHTPLDPSCRLFGPLEPPQRWDWNCTTCISFASNLSTTNLSTTTIKSDDDQDQPAVTLAPNRSNINSLRSRAVETGAESPWVKSLGHTTDAAECASRCVAMAPATQQERCRSFTRLSDSYSKNASRAGLCLAHLDHVWLPLHAEGDADSGLIEWPCKDDMDCSLNGKCGGGKCSCNHGWKGNRCETLSLGPVDRKVLGFNPTQGGKNMSSWGGSVQQINGTWHMWAVMMANHCGISSYLMNSGVVHAVSSAGVAGPYELQDSVLPPFAHEPDVCRAPTGELVMIAVADPTLGGYSSCTCESGATLPSCVTCNNSCMPAAKPTLAIASDAAGPWKVEPIWADGHGENPSIWITKNGSVWGMSRGGNIACYASDWSDLSTWTHGAPHGAKTSLSGSPDAEDPFIYQDDDDHFHALLHNLEGPHMCGGQPDCMVGTHAFSEDGLQWQYGGLAYTNNVALTDGGALLLNRRERPHLVFHEGTRTPAALSNSAEVGGPFGDRSFTLVQPVVFAQ